MFTPLCLKKTSENWVSPYFLNVDDVLGGKLNCSLLTLQWFFPSPDKCFSINIQSQICITFFLAETEPASNKASPKTLDLALTFLIKWPLDLI